VASLKVQDYLRGPNHSLETLKSDYGIEYRLNGDKVSLNYDQLASPMGEELVQECRGLILNNKTFDIIAYPMKKFFNIEEHHAAKIDINNAVVYEKLDGSLLVLSYYNGWQFSTRSMCYAEGNCPSGMTYNELALEAFKRMNVDFEVLCEKLNKRYTYCFELQCPYNHVVVFSQDYKLTLLAVRDLDTLEELPIENIAAELNLPIPQTFNFYDYDGLYEHLKTWNKDIIEHEGLVMVDSNFNRVKLKTNVYKAAHGLISSLNASSRNVMRLVLADKTDDLSFIKDGMVIDKIASFTLRVKVLVAAIENDWNGYRGLETDKEFALAISDLKYKAALFALRRKKVNSAMEFIRGLGDSESGVDKVINWCGLED
jgi:T4 RnlA family RNA ligase